MKKILLALVFLLGAALPAAAQGCGPQNPNCIVPDRPTGDSTNAAADTRFVTNAVNSSTTRSPVGGGSANAIVSAGTTAYIGASNANSSPLLAITSPFSGTLKNFYFNPGNFPGAGQTYTVTIYTGAYGSITASSGASSVSNRPPLASKQLL